MDRARRNDSPPVSPSPLDPPGPRRGRAWQDAPLRVKVTTLIVLAAVVGSTIGGIAAFHYHGPGLWVWSLGLTGLIIVLERLAARWVWGPYEQLVRTLDQITRSDHSDGLDVLPVTRRDEVGRLAGNAHRLASASVRYRRQAHLVRRTMDARVAEATRKATRRLRDIAMRDALTDLGNRRFLEETLEPLVRTVLASQDDLVCVLIDVDNFKQLNDTHGHAAGDNLLILLANLLRASIRLSDYAVRMGGDEFALLLPGCDLDRAKRLALRINSLFRQHINTTARSCLGVALSIGVASLRHEGVATGKELLAVADAKVYQAKRAGKDRVVASETDSSDESTARDLGAGAGGALAR